MTTIEKTHDMNREKLIQTLPDHPLSLVIADAGWGKTWLGEKIREQKRKAFPFAFGVNVEEFEELLNKLASFCEKHDNSSLKHHLDRVRNEEKDIQLTEELIIKLRRDLAEVRPWIWLEDLHNLKENSHTTAFVKILIKEVNPSSYQLFLTTRREPHENSEADITSAKIRTWLSEKDIIVELEGLTTTEIKKLLSDNDIELNENSFRLVENQTQGHPLLLTLFVMMSRGNRQDRALEILEQNKKASIPRLTEIFLEKIWAGLNDNEVRLLSQLSLLSGAAKEDLIRRFQEGRIQEQQIGDTLGTLRANFLVSFSDQKFSISHDVFREYARQIIEQDPVEKRKYQLQIARAYEERAERDSKFGDWLDAGIHYYEGKSYIKSAQIFVRYFDGLLHDSRRQEYIQALQKFSQEDLSKEAALWQQLLDVRSKVAFRLGKYKIALEAYHALYSLKKDPYQLLREGRLYNFRKQSGDFDRAISVLEKARNETTTELLKAQIELELARSYWVKRDIPQATIYLKSAIHVFNVDMSSVESVDIKTVQTAINIDEIPREDWDTVAWALRYAGLIYVGQGNIPATLACWFAAKTLWEKLEDKTNVAAMLINLGGIYEDARFGLIDLSLSQPLLEKAQIILEEQQDLFNLFRLYNHLSVFHFTNGNLQEAFKFNAIAIALNKLGLHEPSDEELGQRSYIYIAAENFEDAEQNQQRIIRICQEMDFEPPKIAYSIMYLAEIYLRWGYVLDESNEPTQKAEAQEKYQQAEQKFNEALEMTGNIFEKQIKLGLAEIYLKTNRLSEAQSTFDEVKDSPQIDTFFPKVRTERIRGELLHQQGELEEAKSKLIEAWNDVKSDTEIKGTYKEEVLVLKYLVSLYEQENESCDYINELCDYIIEDKLKKYTTPLQTFDGIGYINEVLNPAPSQVASIFKLDKDLRLWAEEEFEKTTKLMEPTHDNWIEKIEEAIKSYENIRDNIDFRELLGRLFNELGWAYTIKIRGDRSQNIKSAIECFDEALKIYDEKSKPWADTHYNLGIACERKGDVGQAIKHYISALNIYDDEKYYDSLMKTQHSFIQLISHLGTGEKNKLFLEDGIRRYNSVLEIYTKESNPEKWAFIQNSLGPVHSRLGDIYHHEKDINKASQSYDDAIQCFENALVERKRFDNQIQWAMTHHNLAVAYENLAKLGVIKK